VNSGFDYREEIGGPAAGRTVLEHLARSYRHSDAAEWAARLHRGEVFLGDSAAHADDRLVAGATLIWRRPPWEEPPVPLSFAVLHRDDDLLAVAKPRGLPSVPNGGFLTHTLLHRVTRVFPEATPLHRLGRGTSGLVLFARSDLARRDVAAAWRDGRVHKVYRALVVGHPPREPFTVRAPIGLVPHPRLRSVHAARADGKPAVTHVRWLASRGEASVVEATIPTGRPHQIRIHLAAAGHPLVGDPLYVAGGGPGTAPGLPGDPGYFLHAHRLTLRHPASDEELRLECPLPRELRA